MHTSVSFIMPKREVTSNVLTHSHSSNPRFCPDPYCVCTQPFTSTISGSVTTNSIVEVYAATSGAIVCPTAGAAISEAGCQIVVESKTDSTCGTVVFNTAFCLPSSTASAASATSTTASPGPSSTQAQVSITSYLPPTQSVGSSAAPSYTIEYVDQPGRSLEQRVG